VADIKKKIIIFLIKGHGVTNSRAALTSRHITTILTELILCFNKINHAMKESRRCICGNNLKNKDR